jgi:hypothetical protein
MVHVRWSKSQGVLSRRQFILVKCGLWAYGLTLLAVLIAVYFLWAAPLIWRMLINLLMFFTTPYPKDLLITYDEYLAQAQRVGSGHRQAGGNV